jgi:tetratricopeptide (TPR) repeat protein
MLRAAMRSGNPKLAQQATVLALHARNYRQALVAAELWLRLAPADNAPLETIALIELADNRLDRAQQHVEELVARMAPKTGDALKRVAEIFSRQPNTAGAAQVMDRLVAKYADLPEAHMARAQLADRTGDSATVLAALDRALALRPDWEEAVTAKVAHLAAQKRDAEAFAAADEFLARKPDASRLRSVYARLQLERGNTEEALRQFLLITAQDPRNAEAWFAAGVLAMQRHELEAADDYLLKSLQLRPAHDQTRLLLAQLALERREYAVAERWYRDVRNETQFFEAQLGVALAQMRQGDWKRGLAHLESLTPEDDDEQVRRLLVQEQIWREGAKDRARARKVLDEALARYPDSDELLYARGLLAAIMNDLPAMEKDLRQVLSKNPDNAHALNALGYTLADQTGRIDEARQLVTRALELRPEDPFILDSMGWVQYRLGNNEAAVDYLNRALAKRDDAEIAAHLGEVLWTSGDRTRAEEVWRRALKHSPDNEVLRETVSRLKQ